MNKILPQKAFLFIATCPGFLVAVALNTDGLLAGVASCIQLRSSVPITNSVDAFHSITACIVDASCSGCVWAVLGNQLRRLELQPSLPVRM